MDGLIKTRLILGALIVFLAILCALSFSLNSGWFWTAQVVLFILGSTSAFLFVCSFFRVHIGPKGELCYDPDNIFWKYMAWCYDDKWKDQMPLCDSYWMLAGSLSLLYLLTTIAGLLLYGLGYFLTRCYQEYILGQLGQFLLPIMQIVGIMAVIIIIVFAVISLFAYLASKFRIFEIIVGITMGLMVITLGFMLVGLLPNAILTDAMGLSFAAALFWQISGLLTIALIGSSIYYMVNNWQYLLRFPIFQILDMLKKKACPILTACPYKLEEN